MGKYIGVKFLDNFYNIRTVENYDTSKCWYFVPKINTVGYDLMTDKDIEFHLGRQEKYILAIKRKEEEYKIKKEEELSEQKRIENLNKFLETKTPLQRGKAKKHLVENGLLYGKYYSNFEFVEFMLSQGKSLQQHTYSKNNKTTWGFPNDYNAHIDISKTMYDYAVFLINNNYK